MDIKSILEEQILPFVQRPARYIGGEINAARPQNAEVRLLLSYPDVYEVGMSHLGLKILYEIVNGMSRFGAERAFAVWEDMEALMRKKGIPLFSLESFTPAKEFHIWGFSLQAELTYTNILTMLDLAGLPLKAKDRSWPGCPLILGGGAGATNPEPLADFFDLFLIGDGEETIVEILSAYRKFMQERPRKATSLHRGKQDRQGEQERRGENIESKEELLKTLVKKVSGLYAPALYRVEYEKSSKFRRLYPVARSLPARVKKRAIKDLNSSRIKHPLISLTEIVHERAVVEIMRGCKRGCRFCQAGWTGHPVREKTKEVVIRQALSSVEKSGYEEVSLLSLSSGDYRNIEEVMEELSPLLARRKVSLSLPSLNVASVSDRVFGEIKRVRKSSITLAPEAGTARLRQVINKKLDPELLWELGQKLKEMGWRLIKLYFMIGLPTERVEDIEAIAETINRMSRWGGALNVTISVFIPKPGTPFQWCDMADLVEVKEKQMLIRRLVRSRRVKLKFRLGELSRIEGVVARGDRRVGTLLQAAWEEGCRFDDWRECFSPEKWERAFRKAALSPEFYLRPPYGYDDPLPWSHIDTGVSKKILIREARKAIREGTSGP